MILWMIAWEEEMGDLKVLTYGYMGGFEKSTKLLLETSTLDRVG